MTLVVVGDVLLDREVVGTVDRLCPEAPVPVLSERSVHDRPGGAGLAAMFAADGPREVVVIAGFSADASGQRLRELLRRAGIRVVAVPLHGPTSEKIRLRAGQHLLLRLDRGDADPRAQLGPVPAQALQALRSASAILVSDYGRGVAAHPELAVALREQATRVPVVWDPHPKGPAPVPGTRLATPNRSEAAGFVAALRLAGLPGQPAGPSINGGTANGGTPNGGGPNGGGQPHDGTARRGGDIDPQLASAGTDGTLLRRRWSAQAVAVTVADRGAVLCADGAPQLVAAPFAATGDACGAGDRFASAALTALAGGASTVDAVRAAVDAATSYVAAGGALAIEEPKHSLTRSR